MEDGGVAKRQTMIAGANNKDTMKDTWYKDGGSGSNVDTVIIDGANGTITCTGNIQCAALTETSDDRLKSRTTVINNATSVLKQLNPVKYELHPEFRVPEGVEDTDLSGVEHFTQSGLIAQDVEKIPELAHIVKTTNEGDTRVTDSKGTVISSTPGEEVKRLHYSEFIAYLVAGFKEMEERLAILERA